MKTSILLSVLILLAPACNAQPKTFTVNPNTSEVHIKLNTTHEIVNGDFHVQSGSIAFDTTTAQMTGSVVVGAGTGKTGNSRRDNKMTKDILKAGQFATVSFAPTVFRGSLAPSGDSAVQVTGTFTLCGTPHEITIPMQIHIAGSAVTAKAQFVVPYVEWGLKNPSFLVWKADNDVKIDLTMLGVLSQ